MSRVFRGILSAVCAGVCCGADTESPAAIRENGGRAKGVFCKVWRGLVAENLAALSSLSHDGYALAEGLAEGAAVKGVIARGEPLLNVIAVGGRQLRHLLPAVGPSVDGLRDLSYLLRGQAVCVKEVKQSGALLALAAYQPWQDGVETAAAAAGNAEGELKAVAVPVARAEAVALLAVVSLHEKLTLMEHQGVYD